jgi:hypothetical protein
MWRNEILAGGDNTVFIDNVRISPPVSQLPPTVALTSPANNDVFSAANPIPLSVSITTNGNFIGDVQYYVNTNYLIAEAAAPYTYSWTNANAGLSTLFARLIFNGSNTVDSAPISITITNPQPILSGIGFAADQTLSVQGVGLQNRPYFLDAASNLTPPINWIREMTNISDSGEILYSRIYRRPTPRSSFVWPHLERLPQFQARAMFNRIGRTPKIWRVLPFM